MKFSILTLFPEIFPGLLKHSIPGRALKNKKFKIETYDIRKYSHLKNSSIDGKPIGGGAGMIMRPDILQNGLNHVIKKQNSSDIKTIYFTPKGRVLKQEMIKKISNYKNIIIVCGRYEGIDQRFVEKNNIDEISVGDYILTGGEIPAFILIDACIRFIPEVLGNKKSLKSESFENNLLEYPQYTKPMNWEGRRVPDVLFSGNHIAVEKWRNTKSIETTKKTRPDLWKLYKSKIREKK